MRKLLSMLVIFLLLFTYALPAYAVDLDDGSEGSTEAVETVADETPPSISVNPSGQEFTDSLSIDISSDEENTRIYYTLDGSEPTSESLVYNETFIIEASTTLKTFGVDSSNNASAVITEDYTLEVPPAESEENNEEREADVTAPIVSADPVGQSFTESLTIELLSNEENTSIYYTLDGEDPTTNSTLYTEPFIIEASTTVKAFGVDGSENASDILVEDYVLNEPAETESAKETETDATAPIVSMEPVGQSFTESLTIELLSNEENTSIYYTLDGEDPTTNSTLYTEPFIIEASTTVKAFGVDGSENASDILVEDYVLNEPAETESAKETETDATAPIVSMEPVGQSFTESLTIELLSNEENTSIYYTLDGEDPSTNSTLYVEPFIIEASTTVKAFGVDGSDNASEAVTEEYTLEVPPIETEVDEVKINTINEIPSITALNTFEITGPYDYNTLYFQDGESNIYEYYLDTQEIALVIDDPMPYFDIASQNGDLYGVRNNGSSAEPNYQIMNITNGESLAFSPTAIEIFTLAENNGLFYYQSGDTLFATDLTDEYIVKTGLPTVGPRADCTAYNGSIFYTSSNNHLIEVKVSNNTYTDHGDLNVSEINGLTIGHDHLQVSYNFPTSKIDFIDNSYSLDGNNVYTHRTNINGMAKGNSVSLPVAENVVINGNPVLGETLTGVYNYVGSSEGNSQLQWYSNGTKISDATGDTLYLDNEHYGKSITFSVTPVSTEIPTTGEKVTSTPVTVGIDPNIWIYTDYDYELYIDGNRIEPLPEVYSSSWILPIPPMPKNPVDVNYINYETLDDPYDILIAVKTLPHCHEPSDVEAQCFDFHPGLKVVYKTPDGNYIVTDTEWKAFPSMPPELIDNITPENAARPPSPISDPKSQNGIMWYEEDYLNLHQMWNNAIEVRKAFHWPEDNGPPGFPTENLGKWIWSNLFFIEPFSENSSGLNCIMPPHQRQYYFRNHLKSGHLVTFDPNNGEEEWYVYVPTGDTFDPPEPSPIKDGYRFLYWRQLPNESPRITEALDEYDFTKPVEGDLSLEAVWEKVVTQHEYDIYTISDTDSSKDPYLFGLKHNYSDKNLVLLAQLRRQHPELIKALDMSLQPDIYNLRNDITDGANKSEIENGTYTTLSDAFEVRMEDSDQGVVNMLYPFNYFASDKGILYDASDVPIGYLNTEVIDYNDDSGESNVYDPEWHEIKFDHSFDNPIVIAQFSSYTGRNYSHLRLKNVTSNSVEVFIEEWDEHRQTKHHNHELISIMVIEEGVHTLSDKTVIEATQDVGRMDYNYYQFSQNYDDPVVFSQSQDYNNTEQVWMGQKYINNSSVHLKMLREHTTDSLVGAAESLKVLDEKIGYIVIGEISEEVPTVDIVPDSTSFDSEIDITMTTNNPGNTIFYTLDGSDPTPLSSIYSGPITITEDTTVKAIAKDTSGNLSDIVTEDYSLYVLNGTLSVDSTLVYEGDEVIASLYLYDQHGDPIIGQSVKIYDDNTGKNAPESGTDPGLYTATFTPDIGVNEFTAKVSGFTAVEFNTVEVRVVNIIETLEHGRSVTGTTSLDPNITPYNDLALIAQLTKFNMPELGMLRSNILEQEEASAMNGEPIVNYREDNFYSGVEDSYLVPALSEVEDENYPLNYLASETGVIKNMDGKIIGVVGHELIPLFNGELADNGESYHEVEYHENIENPVVLAHLGSYHGFSDVHARVMYVAPEYEGPIKSVEREAGHNTYFGVTLEVNAKYYTDAAKVERRPEPTSFEVISYLVIEEGVHQVGGVIVEAEKVSGYFSNTTHEFSDHYYMPSVFSQTQTGINLSGRWMREDNITSNTVDLTLQRAPNAYDGPVYDQAEAPMAIQEYPEEVAVVLVADNLVHEVTFTNTGSSSFDPQMVEHGTTATDPGTPSRSGYSFTGWTYEGSPFDFDLAVEEDMELLATWSSEEEVYYTVTFDSAGGTAVSSQSILEGEKVEEPSDPTRSGYIFDGWTYDGSLYDFDLAVEGDMELLAKWISEEEVYYTVTFDSAGGTAVSSQSVLEGNKVEEPSDPTRSGYTFDGWTYDGSLYDFDLAVEGDMELLATWSSEEEVYHTVTFDSAGGTAVSSQSVLEGNKVEEPSDPTRSGYTFEGWTYEGSPYDFDLVVEEDMELLATWSSNSRGTTSSSGEDDATIDAERDDLRTVMNEPISVETSELMANDTDAEEFVSVQDPTNGSVSLSGTTVTFTPDTNYVGIAYFYYTIADGSDTDNGVVVVTVEEATEINPFETPLGGDPDALILINPEETPLGVIDYSLPYVLGYPDQSFKPNRQITRGEMATIFARILFLDTSNPGDPIYSDVKPDDWYYKYVQAVSQLGIFGGYEGDEFKPNRPISHAEIAAAFSEYWELKGIEISNAGGNYSDIEGHWAEDEINRFFNAGISVGFMDGTFKPNAFTTRAELVVMVNRTLNRPELVDAEPTFPDVQPNFWGFGAIEAASKRHQGESVFNE